MFYKIYLISPSLGPPFGWMSLGLNVLSVYFSSEKIV